METGAAPATPSMYPMPPGYPYYATPPRRDNLVWVIVIVVVLIVAVPVVMAAVLYVMVSGLIGGPSASKPTVAFATPTPLGLGEQLTVASASQAAGPANYRLNLGVSGVTGAAVGMPPTSGSYVILAVGSQFYRVNWTDVGGEGILSAGDSFTVTRTNVVGTSFVPLPIASTFTFYLLWSDGSQIASVNWLTYSKPVVAFTTPAPLGIGEQITIASASQAVAPANYKVNFAVGSTTGVAAAMPTTGGGFVVLTVGTAFYRVNWTDIGGEKTVNGGDAFTITHADSTGTTYMGLPTATQFSFYLLWSDGSQITSVAWTTP